jgi:hypothetical protein
MKEGDKQNMPKEGYRTITLSDERYERLEQIAKELRKTIPETILFLIEYYRPEPEKQAGP